MQDRAKEPKHRGRQADGDQANFYKKGAGAGHLSLRRPGDSERNPEKPHSVIESLEIINFSFVIKGSLL